MHYLESGGPPPRPALGARWVSSQRVLRHSPLQLEFVSQYICINVRFNSSHVGDRLWVLLIYHSSEIERWCLILFNELPPLLSLLHLSDTASYQVSNQSEWLFIQILQNFRFVIRPRVLKISCHPTFHSIPGGGLPGQLSPRCVICLDLACDRLWYHGSRLTFNFIIGVSRRGSQPKSQEPRSRRRSQSRPPTRKFPWYLLHRYFFWALQW